MRIVPRWIAERRGSLRLRLTAVFGAMFFLAAVVVLAATVLLVHRYGQHHPSAATYFKFDPPLTPQQARQLSIEREQAAAGQQADTRADVLWMLKWGSLVATGVGVTATAAGWLVAGRLLRPLTWITGTAERVAGRTLHQRIALKAPPGEVKSLADSFDRMLERLDESFAGQGRFIANAAHELKTPLVINRTLVEVAMNRRDAPTQVLNLGADLLSVNARHERLVDALLALARSENGTVDRLPTDLAEVTASVVEAAAPAAERAGVTVHTWLCPAPLEGDPVLLEQLARNLLDNAVRYNVSGGTVHVTTEAVPEGVRLTVANTGPVVAPHEVPVLFQPFRRLTDRVGAAKGSGLGLSIVQAVARTHGGDADAAALPDGGLAVTVTLPVRGVNAGR
ncbi:HAMP domain-containing sensor histidine kinase [Streptomyces sp. NPDC026673]|uniref:sensor histidine kinase n=1 Tax=Streptomyces sp. NPDC026673 TaxID=3155724 RepID=UPI0033EEE9AA